jgi:uncharacterized protein involved in exopolysaccharide biosynthesis
MRDVRYFESLSEFLAKQFEAAKIDEAKNATLVQVLDYGIPSERKSKPARVAIVFISSVIGLFIAMILVLIIDHVRRTSGNQIGSKLLILRQHLWRSRSRTP